jgi:phosphoglycerol transferase MdoB-like AlkP superfamily enzyme
LDSNGVRVSQANLDRLSKDSIDQLFLQYEVYVNKRISTFIATLKKETAGNAVILLMSDHGYKDAKVANDATMPFYNLNAVYLPQKN